MKRGGLRVMKEERDIPDAEAAILQERFRDVLTHRVEDAGKRRVLLRKPPAQRAPADTERMPHAVVSEYESPWLMCG